jgi:hypothetical protein
MGLVHSDLVEHYAERSTTKILFYILATVLQNRYQLLESWLRGERRLKLLIS